jgi:ArsR family transcriptional regulator, arsenate/arsenite/antimonite-responsive transcriptional repressor
MNPARRRLTADLLAALGGESRLRIVELLAAGERCVCEITPHFPTAFSVVSHHLAVLERAGVITSRRDGRWMRYRLADDSVLELIELARRFARPRPARRVRSNNVRSK